MQHSSNFEWWESANNLHNISRTWRFSLPQLMNSCDLWPTTKGRLNWQLHNKEMNVKMVEWFLEIMVCKQAY